MKLRFAVAFAFAALAVGFALSLSAPAQQLPRLQEENLAGQKVILPDAASGKVAVLVFGFTHASQTPTEKWAKRLETDFSKSPSFVLYQLPVLEEVPRFLRGMIASGMKKGVPENQCPGVVPVMHHEAELKKLVAYKEADDAYIVVLDRSGQIAYQTHNTTTEGQYAQLKDKVERLLK